MPEEIRTGSLENPQTPLSYPAEWLLDIFNGGRTNSGIRISQLTALQVSTVLACLKLIAGTVGSLPFGVYKREFLEETDRVRCYEDRTNPLDGLLRECPNNEMTACTWLRTVMCHLLLWGNSYNEIIRREGDIIAINPLNPARCRPVRLTKPAAGLPAGTLVFEVTDESALQPSDPTQPKTGPVGSGLRRIQLASNVIHIQGLSLDGRLGQDTVSLAREALGLALASEKYGAKFFGNGAIPAAILTTPAAMDDVALEQARRSLQEAHGGENQHRTMVLEPGMSYTKVSANPNEAQFLQTRQWQRIEICTIFNVPPYMAGVTELAPRATAEQQSNEFLNYTLYPWLRQIEAEVTRKLFNRIERRKLFTQFDTKPLRLADAAARSHFYGSGRQWGFLSANDIREMESMNPIDAPGADSMWMPTDHRVAYPDAPPAADQRARIQTNQLLERQRFAQRAPGCNHFIETTS